MKRFFIEPSEVTKEFPVIEGTDAHHISKVFRLSTGDHIFLFDGSGMEYEATITGVSKNRINILIIKEYDPATESPVNITVGQCYLKDKKMDMLVRHLTEIGITGWLPVVSQFSVPKPDMKKSDSKLQRWEVIAKEAVKQCRRTRVTQILPVASYTEAVETFKDADLKIIFYENETLPLTEIPSVLTKKPQNIFVLLGPEGGFSDKEIDMAKSNGFISASLGPRILRAETASISACTLVQHLFGDMC